MGGMEIDNDGRVTDAREMPTRPGEDGTRPPCFDCPSCLIDASKCPYFGKGRAAS